MSSSTSPHRPGAESEPAILIDREDTIVVLVVITGLLIAATIFVLAYYRRKFLLKHSRRRADDDDEDARRTSSDPSYLDKDTELGLEGFASERTMTSGRSSPVDAMERTVDAASSMASIPFERAESWQSPETNTTFVPVLFESWDEWEGDDDGPWDEEDGMEGASIGEERGRTTIDAPGGEGDVRSHDAIGLAAPSLSSEPCEDCSVERIGERDGSGEEEGARVMEDGEERNATNVERIGEQDDAGKEEDVGTGENPEESNGTVTSIEENHVAQEPWSPTSVAFTKVLDVTPSDVDGATKRDVPSMSFDSVESDGYREFLRVVGRL